MGDHGSFVFFILLLALRIILIDLCVIILLAVFAVLRFLVALVIFLQLLIILIVFCEISSFHLIAILILVVETLQFGEKREDSFEVIGQMLDRVVCAFQSDEIGECCFEFLDGFQLLYLVVGQTEESQ